MPARPQLAELALPYQLTGAKQLAKTKGGILADDMGLGKTFTSMLWPEYLRLNRILVTAPKEVTSNLKDEIRKWTARPIIDIRNKTHLQRETIINVVRGLDEFIVLVNLEAWSRDKDLIASLISLQLDGIIVDEAHHLNNQKTSAFKGVRELAFAFNKCYSCGSLVTPSFKCNRRNCLSGGRLNRFRHCMQCGHIQALVSVKNCRCGVVVSKELKRCISVKGILVMTGTPILNSPDDLWPLLYLTYPEEFGSKRDYTDKYCFPIGGNKFKFRPGAQERLLTKIGNKYVRRTRKDAGIKLPPQTIEILEYDMDLINYRAQWEAYRQLEDFFILRLENEIMPVPEVIVQLGRLRQLVTWPDGIKIRDEKGNIIDQVCIGQSQKLDIVYDKINEYIACGQRVVAFSNFSDPLRELKRRLGSQAAIYDGATSNAERKEIRADFNGSTDQPKWQVVLCNYKSAGESLTLLGATQVIPIDEQWNPGKNQQAYRRVDRIGQRHQTRVHIPRITKTVDMWLARLNANKEKMQADFNEMANYQSDLLRAIRGEVM